LGCKMNLSEKQNAEKGFPFLRSIVPFPGPAHGSYPPFPLAFSMIFISGKNGNGGTVRRPPFLSPSVSRPPGFFSDGFTRRDPPSPKRGIPFAFFPMGVARRGSNFLTGEAGVWQTGGCGGRSPFLRIPFALQKGFIREEGCHPKFVRNDRGFI